MVAKSVDKEKVGLRNSRVVPRLISIALFCVILATGFTIYKDYGISIDEPSQRTHSLVNYRYINQYLWHKDISKLSNLPEIQNYELNFYSMVSQLPLVGVEGLFYFTVDSRPLYLMRHLYTFLIYFISLICFYFICLILFKNSWYGILGTAMLWLYPRFFAESFYNIKDLVFVSFYIMALLCMFKVLARKRRVLWSVYFAFTCALAINTRIMGVMLLLMLFACMLLQDIANWMRLKRAGAAPQPGARQSLFTVLLPYFIVLGGTMFFTFVMTPASWQDPFHYFTTTFLKFSDFDIWKNTVLFWGRLLTTSELPWSYVLVWMGITIPIVYLLLFLVGNVLLVLRTNRLGRTGFSEVFVIWSIALLFLIPVVSIIIFKIKIYNAWRHVYFLFVPFLLMAIYGLKTLMTNVLGASRLRFLPVVLVVGSLLYQAGWIVVNHPYQYVYFNVIGRPVADRFDRDYWHVSITDLYRYILATYHPEIAVVYSPTNHLPQLLDSSQRQHLQLIYTKQMVEGGMHPDFIVELYSNVVGNTVKYDGYVEDHVIWVDGFKIGSVFVSIDYLNSRR
jgi:hypothetical protein